MRFNCKLNIALRSEELILDYGSHKKALGHSGGNGERAWSVGEDM